MGVSPWCGRPGEMQLGARDAQKMLLLFFIILYNIENTSIGV
jgi:hypothetical protein